MRFTGFEVLDASIQRTSTWLNELMQELNWTDRRRTYVAFRCVLQAWRDHLSVKDAVYLGEQLPMLIRGFYFEHWDPAGKPLSLRSRAEFLSILSAYLARDGESLADGEKVASAIFRFLDHKATDGEIADLHYLVPAVLIDLWPPTLRAA
jgi:uncharacterized protein (DUF2267 family)